jgi:hypothetical protein
VYGIRMSYPKLLALYKTFKVPKEKHLPPGEFEVTEEDKRVAVKQNTKEQIKKLMCMHLADCKMKGHRLVYVDLVQANLHELHLLFRSFKD